MIPNENCYADLDPDVKDKFGIPVLRFHWKWSSHGDQPGEARRENVYGDLRSDGRQSRGRKRERRPATAWRIRATLFHEVGGARSSGADAKKSVVNKFNQTWDVKNLFLNDGQSARLPRTPTRTPNADHHGAGVARLRLPDGRSVKKVKTCERANPDQRSRRGFAPPGDAVGDGGGRRFIAPANHLRPGRTGAASCPPAKGYGRDANLVKIAKYKPGRVLAADVSTDQQNKTAGKRWPTSSSQATSSGLSASEVGVIAYIDEWVERALTNSNKAIAQ